MSWPWRIVTVAGGRHEAELAQVGAEGGSGGAGRRVLDDAADGERVARVEGVLALAPDKVDRREVEAKHERLEAVVVVVELGEPLP